MSEAKQGDVERGRILLGAGLTASSGALIYALGAEGTLVAVLFLVLVYGVVVAHFSSTLTRSKARRKFRVLSIVNLGILLILAGVVRAAWVSQMVAALVFVPWTIVFVVKLWNLLLAEYSNA